MADWMMERTKPTCVQITNGYATSTDWNFGIEKKSDDIVAVPPELKQVVEDLIKEYKDYDMLIHDAALANAIENIETNRLLGKYCLPTST